MKMATGSQSFVKNVFWIRKFFRISLGARFRLGATHRPGRFLDTIWLKSLRNNRFYKGLAPNGGRDLPPPAGLPPASPVPPKNFPDASLNQKRFLNQTRCFRIKSVFDSNPGGRGAVPKVDCEKRFGPKPSFWLRTFLRFRLRKTKSLFRNAL